MTFYKIKHFLGIISILQKFVLKFTRVTKRNRFIFQENFIS